MNLNFQHIKDSFFILLFVAVIILFAYFNGCGRSEEPVTKTDTSIEKAKIAEAEYIIDSLLCEIDSIRGIKQVIKTRIETRKVYITSKRDTVRKLITDSTVLAYVDTLETQIADSDSLLKEGVKEVFKLEGVIAQKDTALLNKDIIQAKTEMELTATQADNKKKDRKIKILKVERVLYPAIAIIGGIYLSFKL